MKRTDYVVTWMQDGMLMYHLFEKRKDAITKAKELQAQGFLVDVTKR